jgi:hypothetical protein
VLGSGCGCCCWAYALLAGVQGYTCGLHARCWQLLLLWGERIYLEPSWGRYSTGCCCCVTAYAAVVEFTPSFGCAQCVQVSVLAVLIKWHEGTAQLPTGAVTSCLSV